MPKKSSPKPASTLCDPPRPVLSSNSDPSMLKQMTSNTDSGVFDTQSSVESSPGKENIPVSKLNITNARKNVNKIVTKIVNNPKIVTPLDEIVDEGKSVDVFEEEVVSEVSENDKTLVCEENKDENTTQVKTESVVDADHYVESEPSVSVGDYFSESEGEYEESEQEVEARQDREFEEAQQMKFHTPWRMYHVSKQKGQNITMQDYKDGRRCYPMIESIADFWQQICNVPMPTELKVTHREDMYFFRGGIEPEWEDPSATGGGIFKLELSQKSHRNGLINNLWYELLMAVVGERFDNGELITGVVFSRRQKEDRICIWTRNLSEQGETIEREIKKKLAEQFREFLGIGQSGNLQYITHDENMHQNTTGGNNKWNNKPEKSDHKNKRDNSAKPPINLKTLTNAKMMNNTGNSNSGFNSGQTFAQNFQTTGLTGNGINISLPPRDGASRDQRERKPSGGNNRGRNLSDRSKNQGVNNRKTPKKGGPPAAAGLKSENITLLKRTDDELKSDGAKVSANIMAPNYLKK